MVCIPYLSSELKGNNRRDSGVLKKKARDIRMGASFDSPFPDGHPGGLAKSLRPRQEGNFYDSAPGPIKGTTFSTLK